MEIPMVISILCDCDRRPRECFMGNLSDNYAVSPPPLGHHPGGYNNQNFDKKNLKQNGGVKGMLPLGCLPLWERGGHPPYYRRICLNAKKIYRTFD